MIKYCQTDKYRAYQKKYYQRNRDKIISYSKRYSQLEEGKKSQRNYYQKNREKILKQKQEYGQTKKGKISCKRHNSRRKRNLGFIQISDTPFDNSELIEWHHINDISVVALPRDLHRLYLGKNHRENVMEIVKQIYGNNLKEV